MSTAYRVQRGDNLTKIAHAFGVDSWKTIYWHEDNKGFRRFRPNPDLIFPGDVVQIPDGFTPPGPIPRDPAMRNTGGLKCCSLEYTDQECPYIGDKRNFKCPAGYTKSAWTCTEGTRTVYCGECNPYGVTPQDQKKAEAKKEDYGDCWSGPFACSIWYYL